MPTFKKYTVDIVDGEGIVREDYTAETDSLSLATSTFLDYVIVAFRNEKVRLFKRINDFETELIEEIQGTLSKAEYIINE